MVLKVSTRKTSLYARRTADLATAQNAVNSRRTEHTIAAKSIDAYGKWIISVLGNTILVNIR